MHKNKIKEQIKNYILENYSKISEEDVDQDGVEDGVDVDIEEPSEEEDPLDDVSSVQTIKKLLDSTSTRLSTELRDITQTGTKLSILDDIVKYVLGGFNTTADLPDATLRNHFIKMFGGDDANGEIEEMSTTAGAPAPATKYAFKRKKK